MKRLLVVVGLILILFTAIVFILIPPNLVVSGITLLNANKNAVVRHLCDQHKWEKWWPRNQKDDSTSNKKNHFTFNNYSLNITKVLYDKIEVKIINEEDAYNGTITILPLAADSLAVKWETSFKPATNPVVRILDYRKAVQLKNNMTKILDSLKAFAENKQKLYPYNIHLSSIKDTLYVATKMSTQGYPSTKEIYSLVADLKKYIKSQGATETNYPILNVTTSDNVKYTTMVAIPTDKMLQGTEKIALKRMIIYRDKLVTADVKGGPETISKAYKAMELFLSDHSSTRPVISWEMLITDRSKEADSTQWVTQICVPIA